MEIKPSLGRNTVYASDYCHLDSNVLSGGGTDDIEAIQAILDMATVWGSLHLIMDGAALISNGIRIHSNTTIECLNSDCGFYLADNSNYCIARNADWSTGERKNKNIKMKGGTYNHNCMHQQPVFKEEDIYPVGEGCSVGLVAMKFYGVEEFTMEEVTICDQRRYAFLMQNWKNVYISKVNLNLINLIPDQNQDGLHFHGPGENLHITDIRGGGGDDLIAINTDEGDRKSSISGVVIENVYLENAVQAVRLLCQRGGVLENVFIKNIYGTYSTFGFYIIPWVPEAKGLLRNINIENVFLKQAEPVYTYFKPFAFYVGGNIENLSIKNVSFESDTDDYNVLRVTTHENSPTHIKNLVLDGFYMEDNKSGNKKWIYFDRETNVENFTLKNVNVKTEGCSEALVHIEAPAVVKNIDMSNINTNGFEKNIKGVCENITKK